MRVKFASVVWNYDSGSNPPWQVDAYASVDGNVRVDISKELKTANGAIEAVGYAVKKIEKELGV